MAVDDSPVVCPVRLTPEETKQADANILVTGLLAGGILLVLCAEWLGTLCADHFSVHPGTWNPADAHAAASTFRSLGVMAFVAGVGERVILFVKGHGRPPS